MFISLKNLTINSNSLIFFYSSCKSDNTPVVSMSSLNTFGLNFAGNNAT